MGKKNPLHKLCDPSMTRSSRLHLASDNGTIYVFLTILSLFFLFAWVFYTHGSYINLFFFIDSIDTGMDFFNSLAETRNATPYSQYGTLYPPLANLFFYVLQRCVPIPVVEQWADTHSEIVEMRGSALDLRTHQAPMLMFLLVFITTMLVLAFLLEHLLKDHIRSAKATAVACCFSYGVLYAIERGNILLLAVVFSLLFVSFYNDERPWVRELALISLAIAAGLKLYPALFGLLLLRERQWKRAIRAICYGIAAFILPFFAFEGLTAMKLFFEIFFAFNEGSSSALFSYGIRPIIATLSEILYYFTNSYLPYQELIASVLLVAVLLGCLFCFLKTKDLWKQLLLLTLILVFCQNSGNYTLSFFLLPFVFYLREHPMVEQKTLPYFVFFLVVLLPYPTPRIMAYYLWHSALVIAALGLVTLFLWGDTFCYLRKKHSGASEK